MSEYTIICISSTIYIICTRNGRGFNMMWVVLEHMTWRAKKWPQVSWSLKWKWVDQKLLYLLWEKLLEKWSSDQWLDPKSAGTIYGTNFINVGYPMTIFLHRKYGYRHIHSTLSVLDTYFSRVLTRLLFLVVSHWSKRGGTTKVNATNCMNVRFHDDLQ